MMLATRRAPSALRAFYTAASSTPRCISRPSIQRLASQPSFLAIKTTRPFSSAFPRLQQAAAETAELTDDNAPKEFSRFQELADSGLISPKVIDTITNRMNITTMTEVQQMTLNHCLDGTDVIAQARTGTGKTIAFLLPIIQRCLRDTNLESRPRGRGATASIDDIRALILSPTRELAEQIAVEAQKLVSNTAIKVQTAVGGTQKSMHLRKMQHEGCHILVGTPGRVQDIISDTHSGVKLDNIETFVLDEADRLLDIGFAPAIAEIQDYMPQRTVRDRQTLMFSATVPKSVVELVRQTMRPNFKFIRTVDPDESPTHARIPQNVVFGKALQNQIPIILECAWNAIQAHKKDPTNNLPFKAIVYFGSTAEVNLAYEAFSKMRDPEQARGMFQPHPLEPCRLFQMHGKLAQGQRTRESDGFRRAESALLFSSDVTARGMDFPNVSHVIQVGIPRSSDDYVHRIGRTGRAGKPGEGWLILNADERRDIDKKMRNSGIDLKEADLVTADLDMTRGAQIPGHIARLLKFVEVGVKSVPYSVKSASYAALLGVLQQQNPNRSKQTQLDMMNELARFGWGMQEPPALSPKLASKIGFMGLNGLRLEDRDSFRDGGDRSGGGDMDRRGGGRFGGGRKPDYDPRDPFGQGGGKGVFGGDGFGEQSDARAGGFGRGSRGSSGFDKGSRSGGGFDRGSRGGSGGFDRGSRGSGGFDRGSRGGDRFGGRDSR